VSDKYHREGIHAVSKYLYEPNTKNGKKPNFNWDEADSADSELSDL